MDDNSGTDEVDNNMAIFHSAGGFVIGISSTDADAGQNGRLRYRLTGKHFKINSKNGVVTASSRFEQKFTYETIVSDRGDPSL